VVHPRVIPDQDGPTPGTGAVQAAAALTLPAIAVLTAQFGEPERLECSYRWRYTRPTGTEIRLELHLASRELWVFDPEGRGLRGAYSFEVESELGQAWLRSELRRLLS
jgi:hypothetical protein